MAGWLHEDSVDECFFVFPLCGFSLSLFCNKGVLHFCKAVQLPSRLLPDEVCLSIWQPAPKFFGWRRTACPCPLKRAPHPLNK